MIIEHWRCLDCSDRMQRNKKPINSCNYCFRNQSRLKAESLLEQLKGNPITMQIAGNKIWNDHLKRCDIK